MLAQHEDSTGRAGPLRMHKILASHSRTSVQAEGWSRVRNSELLKRGEADFDLLITADQNILYQQNLSGRHNRNSRTFNK